MRLAGRLHKSKRWWAVEIPMLRLHTQAKTRKGAYRMAKDAIELAVDRCGFEVTIHPGSNGAFGVEANDETALLAFALRQLRSASGRTVREVAQRIGSTSPTAYSQYESGQRKPSVEKLTQLLRAIDDDLVPVITLST
jgi:DNA-binding XRE family transcriptional regulator